MSETGATTVAGSPPSSGVDPTGRRTSLQLKLVTGLVVLVALGAVFWPKSDGTFEAPGGFLLADDGRPATLGERFAPVTLLHFWSTWCPPCLTEVPSLYRLGEDAAGQDFSILMVAVDDEVSDVRGFLGDRAAGVLYDPNWEVAHRYGTRLLPETYLLVGRKVVDKFIGATNWDDPSIRRRIMEKVDEHRSGGESLQLQLG